MFRLFRASDIFHYFIVTLSPLFHYHFISSRLRILPPAHYFAAFTLMPY